MLRRETFRNVPLETIVSKNFCLASKISARKEWFTTTATTPSLLTSETPTIRLCFTTLTWQPVDSFVYDTDSKEEEQQPLLRSWETKERPSNPHPYFTVVAFKRGMNEKSEKFPKRISTEQPI